MSYAGSLHRHAGQVGIVAPPASSTGVTPSNVLTDAISAAIGLQPLTVAQATQALMQCPNVFDAVYKLDPVQFNRALQNWSAGSMGPITATNLCTKLDQLRQDLNQLQAPAPPVSTPPSNAEATGQKRGYKSVLLLGGLVVAMSGFAWWSSMHAHGARRNPNRKPYAVVEWWVWVRGRRQPYGPFNAKSDAERWLYQQGWDPTKARYESREGWRI